MTAIHSKIKLYKHTSMNNNHHTWKRDILWGVWAILQWFPTFHVVTSMLELLCPFLLSDQWSKKQMNNIREKTKLIIILGYLRSAMISDLLSVLTFVPCLCSHHIFFDTVNIREYWKYLTVFYVMLLLLISPLLLARKRPNR